ncbi:MAG: hypothetical protein WC655_16980, partial [Candidatus Hydrogenedentales bacterium]
PMASLTVCEGQVAQSVENGLPQSADPPSSIPMDLTVCGDLVYFSADDGQNGRELWSVDVSGHCRLVSDVEDGPKGSNPLSLKDMGSDIVFFSAETALYGREAYLHGRLPSDLVFLGDLAPGFAFSGPAPIAAFGHTVFFDAETERGKRFVYKAATSGKSCTQLSIPSTADPSNAAMLSDGTLIVARGPQLWKCSQDSVDASKFWTDQTANLPIDHLVPLGTSALFRGCGGGAGSEIWVTDGTAEGTRILRDMWPGPA